MFSPAATKLVVLVQIFVVVAEIKDAKYVTGPGVLTNSYIVALDSGTYADRAYSIHAQFYRDLASRGVNWTSVKEYRDPLLTGAVLKLPSDADLVRLTDAVGAQFVRPMHMYNVPQATISAKPRASKRSGGIPWSHTITGVDKVHAAGYHGQGVTIGIIDSGIDYTHPALGRGFGPGYKVVGGHDFVGDDFTGRDDSPPPQPKPDPLDKCDGHGTKVAGIVGANPNLDHGVIGVAYMAKLNAYRVLGCSDVVREDILIDALIRAYRDGNDIITISIAYTKTWQRAMASALIDRIAAHGRIVTVAIGNHGKDGAWSTDYIGVAQRVIGVGSATRKRWRPILIYQVQVVHICLAPALLARLGVALSAPGEAVMSTTLYGGYWLCSGTSVAAPFVAGSIALWLQVKGKREASKLAPRTTFQNTALPMRSFTGDTIDTVARQGAGLIQVHDAIYSTSRMFPAELLLNDTTHAQLVWTVYIRNLGQETVTYALTHIPAAAINTMSGSSKLTGSIWFGPQTATISFSRSSLTVTAGSIGIVIVSVRPPTKSSQVRFPVYSGYIVATGSDGSTLRSVYLGLAASMKRMKILNPHLTFMHQKYQPLTDGKPISDPVAYSMQGTDTPLLYLGLWMSTPLLRLDLVDASTRAGLVVKYLSASRSSGFSRRLMSRCTSWALLSGKGLARGICSDRMKSVGLIEERWDGGLIRWGGKHVWFESIVIARFVDNSPIPDGQYRLLLRVLKRYGDPNKKSDYEAWIGPVFIVRRD